VLVELAVPYADVRAGDLSLSFGAPPEPALEVMERTVGDVVVQLRLLGCSHQALCRPAPVSPPAADEAPFSETVACRPGRPGGLPDSHAAGRYRFRARVERHGPEAYAAHARALAAAAAADPDGLAGVFPGPALAFTALRLREAPGGGATWTSWHGYPQTGELVVTHSVLRSR
jgi:hypothetical protein